MLRGGLVLKIDEEKAHLPRSAFSFCCVGRVQPLWGLRGLGVRDRSLSVRYPQACREDSCQMGNWFFFISDAHEVVCGAVMADVVSAVFHLTHLVQWNKWPGSKCCFTVAESASPNISTDSVVLDTVFIYRQRLPLPLEDKCKKKESRQGRGGSERLDCLTATCRAQKFQLDLLMPTRKTAFPLVNIKETRRSLTDR